MNLEEKVAARKAEREELYRLDEGLRREAGERKKDVLVVRKMIEDLMVSPVALARLRDPIKRK